MPARLQRLWQAGRETAAAYSRNLCPQLAAAIAYRVLFSLFPLAIFLVSIFGLLIENAERRDEIVTWFVENLRLSPDGSVRLEEAVAGLGSPTSTLGLIALLGVFWAASGMMAAIRIALTSIWGSERRQVWRGKTFDLVLVLLAGVLLLVAFALNLVVRLVEDMGSRVGSVLGLDQLGATAGDAAQAVLSVAVVFAVALALYRYVPPTRPPLTGLWGPALLVAVVIQLTEFGYGFYLSRFADYNLVYGSLGAVIGFLFLVYLCAAIFLFGAQLAATWPTVGKAACGR